MVFQRSYRFNGGPGECLLGQGQVTQGKALESLLVYELGYGGVVTQVSETFLEVKTKVLRTLGRTVFTGTREEMLPLIEAAVVYIKLSERDGVEVVRLVTEQLEGHSTLVQVAAGLILVGAGLVKATLATLLEVREDEVDLVRKMSLPDLMAAYQLRMEGDQVSLGELV